MAKIKTRELQGVALDYAVAQCELTRKDYRERGLLVHRIGYGQPMPPYSTGWNQGGPIIEREKIMTNYIHSLAHLKNEFPKGYWCANGNFRSHTPLIAAMRCYVASKLGEEVEVPDELA